MNRCSTHTVTSTRRHRRDTDRVDGSTSSAGVRSGLRREPTQQRGIDTVERILDAATEVLVDSGFEGFNTNEIAARADVNIATVYSYFVDKFAILQQLVHRLETKRNALIGDWTATLTGGEDWATWFPAAVDQLVRFRTEYPGGVEIFASIKALPELRETELALERGFATLFAEALRTKVPSLGDERASALARVIVISGAAVLDRACRTGATGEVDRPLIDAYVEMCTTGLELMSDD